MSDTNVKPIGTDVTESIKRVLPRSQFVRNVLTLMTGTTIAQAIPIAMSPILTRIYSPNDFGIFAFYMSIVSIVSVVATGRYEMAIMMPEDDDEVTVIVFVASLLMGIVALITFALAVVFNAQIASLLGRQEIARWLYFVPVSIIVTGLYQILNYLLIRDRKFRQLSVNKICFSVISGPSQVGMGLLGFGALGMLASNIFSFVITCWMILRSPGIRQSFKMVKKENAQKIARKYDQYPKFDIPAMLVNLVANQLPLLSLGKYFGLGTLGFYSLMNRTLMAPIGLISNSILAVFKQRATEDFQRTGNFRNIYLKVLIKLSVIGLVPFAVLGIYAPDLFCFAFGAQWRKAGVMAQILSPAFFLNFLVNPLSYSFYIVQRQNTNLILNIAFLLLMALAILLGVLRKDPLTFVLYISIAQCINYVIYLFMSYKLSGGCKCFGAK